DGLPGRRSLDDSGHDDFHAPAMKGLNTEGVLKACGDGSLEALWLVGADPLVEWHDRTQGERALETVPFLVVQAHSAGEAMAFASVVLPMTAPAEQDGTYTSAERRVQRLRPILPPEGEAKPAWRIFSEMSLRLRPETPLFNPGDVMERIAREVPVFEAAHFAIIPSEGALLDS
ncbi:MAG: molybdopterin-dependent oxidoreductase, partial [Fimbriimonas ginsengisoli]|nr:molybdopterin-dependent oxidoreductase [Fimbriimonas ginsengisoli]